MPTTWDRLAAAGLSANYYYSNVPFLALWGVKISRDFAALRRVSPGCGQWDASGRVFCGPRYTILDDGTGNDDHPHADIREGDLFLFQTFGAVAKGPKWAKTVFVVDFDECGGFFEHVAPPRATAANQVDTDIANGKTLLGFRVPTVVASPFTLGNPSNPQVNGLVFDHTSVLKLIEWRWGLEPLTPRDASSDIFNLAYAMNFRQPNSTVPSLPAPQAPLIAAPCLQNLVGGIFRSAGSSSATEWKQLGEQAASTGYVVRQ